MVPRRVIYLVISIVLILFISVVVYLSFIGPGKPWYTYLILIVAVIISLFTVIQGVDAFFGLVDRFFGVSYPLVSAKTAKNILRRLAEVGAEGVKADIFYSYVMCQYDELQEHEKKLICDQLERNHLIQRAEDYVKLTAAGERFMRRLSS